MAINLDDRYPGRANPRSLEYPQGSFKDRSAPDAQDGTYLQQDWANDIVGFLQYLLARADIKANGIPDTAIDSQYAQALIHLIRTQIENTDLATISTNGLVRLASASEAANRNVNNRVITPQSLAQAFEGSNRGNGWQKMPNGMIIQGGVVSVAGGQTATFSFPVSFSSNAVAVVASKGSSISGQDGIVGAEPASRTQFKVTNLASPGVMSGVQWIAWGY